MNTVRLTKFQEALNRHFRIFMEEKIGEEYYDVMPVRHDIPKIKVIHYNPSDDIFELIFQNGNDLMEKDSLDNDIKFLVNENNVLFGIRIYNFQRLRSQTSNEKISFTTFHTPSVGGLIKKNDNVRERQIFKRKMSFFKDIMSMPNDNDVSIFAPNTL